MEPRGAIDVLGLAYEGLAQTATHLNLGSLLRECREIPERAIRGGLTLTRPHNFIFPPTIPPLPSEVIERMAQFIFFLTIGDQELQRFVYTDTQGEFPRDAVGIANLRILGVAAYWPVRESLDAYGKLQE